MNRIVKLHIVVFIACAITMFAFANSNVCNTPDGMARLHYQAMPEFQDGSVVLDDIKPLSGWNDAPEGFSVVLVSARRLGNGAPDRGRHEILILNRSLGVIGTISGFSSVPSVTHEQGMLRIVGLPPISLRSSRDAFRLAGGANASQWIVQSDLVGYGRLAAESALAEYARNGRDSLQRQTVLNLLGSSLGSSQESTCGQAVVSGIKLQGKFPDRISSFTIDEPTMDNANDPRLEMSKTWETTIHASITDIQSVRHRITILVVGDPCDRDRVSGIYIE